MAKLSPSSIMYGARGKVGGLIFKQVNGQTVVCASGSPRGKRSELQVVFNDKMREAALHARAVLRDPATRAHYEKKKKRMNVSSAYTAACTDFLREGKTDVVGMNANIEQGTPNIEYRSEMREMRMFNPESGGDSGLDLGRKLFLDG